MERLEAKKSLGQNFLKSEKILNDIADSGKLENGEIILEIGPGEGALTEILLRRGAKVLAVEKDDRAIPILQDKFKEYIENETLKIIHGDILELEDMTKYGLFKGQYKLIANIPYYITGEILRRFLETENNPKDIVLLVQKEVADRIVSKDGKESILSISVKAFGTPKFIKTVKAGNFRPVPNVDSAILAIYNISKSFFIEKNIDIGFFFSVLKAGFAHKRKFLMKNLENELPVKEILSKILPEIWQKMGIKKEIRAESLSLEAWGEITRQISTEIKPFLYQDSL